MWLFHFIKNLIKLIILLLLFIFFNIYPHGSVFPRILKQFFPESAVASRNVEENRRHWVHIGQLLKDRHGPGSSQPMSVEQIISLEEEVPVSEGGTQVNGRWGNPALLATLKTICPTQTRDVGIPSLWWFRHCGGDSAIVVVIPSLNVEDKVTASWCVEIIFF